MLPLGDRISDLYFMLQVGQRVGCMLRLCVLSWGWVRLLGASLLQPSPLCPASLLQDEVGVRLTQVDPGAADWRAMNILTLYYCRPQYL